MFFGSRCEMKSTMKYRLYRPPIYKKTFKYLFFYLLTILHKLSGTDIFRFFDLGDPLRKFVAGHLYK